MSDPDRSNASPQPVGEGAQVVAALHAMLAAAKTRPHFALDMLPAATPLI